jgi:hypothetical protein
MRTPPRFSSRGSPHRTSSGGGSARRRGRGSWLLLDHAPNLSACLGHSVTENGGGPRKDLCSHCRLVRPEKVLGPPRMASLEGERSRGFSGPSSNLSSFSLQWSSSDSKPEHITHGKAGTVSARWSTKRIQRLPTGSSQGAFSEAGFWGRLQSPPTLR